MHPSTIRTTLLLRPGLLQRLKLFARETKKPMSEVVEAGISYVLDQHEKQRLKKMYQGFRELQGMIKADPTTPSTAIDIDELLYGENGVWKGSHAK